MRRQLLSLAIGLLLSGTALAQQAPNGQGSGPDLNRLHAALRLNPQQEGAWASYAAALTPDSQAQSRRQAAQQMLPTLPTPRRIALMQSEMAADAADLRRIGDAVVAFYGQLTPAQQQVFDRETLPQGSPAGG
jgi:hypothetical protein